jgi:hypothetical protein
MDNKYVEYQKFRQPWVWALMLFCLFVVGYSGQLGGVIVVLVVSVLFWVLTLQTIIDREGISFRWLPFQRRFRLVKWEEIDRIVVRRYAPITEFGGWGMKYSFKATAHTVSGHFGIQIWKRGKTRSLLIGTQQPDETRKYLEEMSMNSNWNFFNEL